MSIKNFVILQFCKLSSFFIHLLGLGAGSTWPGHIALALNKYFVGQTLPSRVKVVYIAGTNGKTTTSTLLTTILEKAGHKVFHNEEGANLLNGIASAVVKNYSLMGNLDYDVAIFEVDENTLPQAIAQAKPHAVLLLNLFRDQLDRYGEVNTIAQKWRESLLSLPASAMLFLNADDPRIKYLGQQLKANVTYFGISDKYLSKKEIPHDVDSVYCPRCGRTLTFTTMSYSHLGDYSCQSCGFKREEKNIFTKDFKSALLGTYNVYNTIAASCVANLSFGQPLAQIATAIKDFKPAFGRQEIISYKGKKVLMLLSKNPTGFNQSIEVVKAIMKPVTMLLALNDRIPDGQDVSWIWDVEYEAFVQLPNVKSIVVTGDRTYDLALRLQYAGGSKPSIVEVNTDQAVETAVTKTKKQELLVVLATYSAMLDIRKILHGHKLP